MKKLLFICSVVATLLTACETPENIVEPSFEITSTQEINVGSGNTMGIITYQLTNPVIGVSIEAEANVEWINSFDFSQMGKIGYKVDANSTYDERNGVITVTYDNYSIELNLKQAGKVRPEEKKIEAPYLLGHYYGDYAGYNYNYYLVFSESNYDATGAFASEGYKFFLDIYSEERPADYNNIRVPNGVYTFNPNNDGKAGTFLESFSIYKEYDNGGIEVAEHADEEGVLTVTDDLVKLEVKFTDEDSLYTVTFSGDYTMQDRRSEAGGIY
jgi:hypothetical protein